jgi:hypothetical protein
VASLEKQVVHAWMLCVPYDVLQHVMMQQEGPQQLLSRCQHRVPRLSHPDLGILL